MLVRVLSLVSLSACLLAPCGCREQPKPDPVPPFSQVDFPVSAPPWTFSTIFEDDPEGTDKRYRGKIIEIEFGMGEWSRNLHVDDDGRTYFSVRKPSRRDEQGTPLEWKEAIRCYLYRPEKPIVEDQGSQQAFGIKGVCKGMVGGVVILENCSIYTYQAEGPDW